MQPSAAVRGKSTHSITRKGGSKPSINEVNAGKAGPQWTVRHWVPCPMADTNCELGRNGWVWSDVRSPPTHCKSCKTAFPHELCKRGVWDSTPKSQLPSTTALTPRAIQKQIADAVAAAQAEQQQTMLDNNIITPSQQANLMQILDQAKPQPSVDELGKNLAKEKRNSDRLEGVISRAKERIVSCTTALDQAVHHLVASKEQFAASQQKVIALEKEQHDVLLAAASGNSRQWQAVVSAVVVATSGVSQS